MDNLKGKRVQDNDPRNEGRTRLITRVDDKFAYYFSDVQVGLNKVARINRIRLDRIFTDGKKRARGWNLIG